MVSCLRHSSENMCGSVGSSCVVIITLWSLFFFSFPVVMLIATISTLHLNKQSWL